MLLLDAGVLRPCAQGGGARRCGRRIAQTGCPSSWYGAQQLALRRHVCFLGEKALRAKKTLAVEVRQKAVRRRAKPLVDRGKEQLNVAELSARSLAAKTRQGSMQNARSCRSLARHPTNADAVWTCSTQTRNSIRGASVTGLLRAQQSLVDKPSPTTTKAVWRARTRAR